MQIVIPRQAKARGEWVEVHFSARAVEHGLHVAKPYGDSLPYDFLVEHGGRMSRVQVKSTSFQSRGHPAYQCLIHGHGGRRYAIDDIDFIAAYIIPEEAWYIVPFRRVANYRNLSLNPHNPRNRYRRYFEAWHLLLSRRRDILS